MQVRIDKTAVFCCVCGRRRKGDNWYQRYQTKVHGIKPADDYCPDCAQAAQDAVRAFCKEILAEESDTHQNCA